MPLTLPQHRASLLLTILFLHRSIDSVESKLVSKRKDYLWLYHFLNIRKKPATLGTLLNSPRTTRQTRQIG